MAFCSYDNARCSSQAEDEQCLSGDGLTPFTSSCEALIILCVCICVLVCISINSRVYLVHHSQITEAESVKCLTSYLNWHNRFPWCREIPGSNLGCLLAVHIFFFFCGYSQSFKADARIILLLGPSHFQAVFILSSIHYPTHMCSIVLGTLIAYLHDWQKEAMVIAWKLYSSFCVWHTWVIPAHWSVRFIMIIGV